MLLTRRGNTLHYEHRVQTSAKLRHHVRDRKKLMGTEHSPHYVAHRLDSKGSILLTQPRNSATIEPILVAEQLSFWKESELNSRVNSSFID